MNHFKQSEFFTNGKVTSPETLKKIDAWISLLNPIRETLGFRVKITDGVRFGEGTSQHYYKGNGAVDLRPVDRENKAKMIALGVALAVNPFIGRVCYYLPSERFKTGGFHIDNKTSGKSLFINRGSQIKWERVELHEFILSLM
jgi:hypothetical protein